MFYRGLVGRQAVKLLVDIKEQSFRCIYTSVVKMEKKEHLQHTANNFREPDIVPATISKITDLSPTIRALTLDVEQSNIKTNFKAGQWVDFFIPGERQVGGFSMWNSPDAYAKSGKLELAIKFSKWPPAHWVHTKSKEGDRVAFRFGGDVYYPTPIDQTEEPHSLLLLAGGIGINPLLSTWLQARSMCESESRDSPARVAMLYSAASSEELVFRDIIDCTTAEMSNFTAAYYVTGPGADRTGRIAEQDVSDKLSELQPGRTVSYICGPPNFIKDMMILLKKLGLDKKDIRYELWY